MRNGSFPETLRFQSGMFMHLHLSTDAD
ncbi:hypothetical protein BRAS3843_170009 [Bradyrhizobium sp. STM 3843]|nr:hypothetical protein BRAS3843_170009 [Bradyrhizobium sp. STM 3843]